MATTNVESLGEVWKDVPLTNGFYQVSNIGNFRSTDRIKHTKRYSRFYKGRKLKLSHRADGYYRVYMGRDKQVPKTAHRLVAMAFIPNPDNKPFVNHKDGNKKNNRIENLEWATRQENEDHAFATGLKNSTGEANVFSKLNDDIVRQMRAMYVRHKVTYVMIGKHFGVHWQTVKRVVTRERWGHVQ